jgi:RNA-binding protein Musashi
MAPAVAAGCQVFVGGLLNKCTDEDVLRHFATFGDVTDVMVAIERETNASKGFAFVVFAQEAQVGGLGLRHLV